MTITDEMVEKAWEAAQDSVGGDYVDWRVDMRAVLEAVAPMLIAQGIREAIAICDDGWESAAGVRGALHKRAQELDPK